MHQRVQCLDAAVHHFGESGDIGDAHHRQTSLLEGAGGAAGRDQLEPATDKAVGEVNQAGFVGNTNERSRHMAAQVFKGVPEASC